MENSVNIRKRRDKIEIFILKILIVINIVLTILLPFRMSGMLSKLKYSSFENIKLVSIVDSQSAEDKDYVGRIDEDGYKVRMNELLEYMLIFVNDVYGIKLKIPKYTLIISDGNDFFTAGCDDNIIISVCRSKLERDSKDYEVLFIHELFHLLSCQDGNRTRISKYSEAVSVLAEGYTDMLTDKFLDYMKWDDYLRLRPRSAYTYFSKILDCFFLKEGNEQKFANYYFLDDFTFNEEFDAAVRKSTYVSLIYFPYNSLDLHCVIISENDYNSESDFLVSFELVAYYLSSFPEEKKKMACEYFKEIELWANRVIYDNNEADYTYFYDVLYNKV